MRDFIVTLSIGIAAGIIDVLPMIKMKLAKDATVSAFVFYLIIPFFIFNISLFGMPWWLKGAVITFLSALPVMIIAAQGKLKQAVPIAVMSVVLGTLIGTAGYFLGLHT